MNKRGFQITVNTIVAIIIGLVVLLALILMFTGAGRNFMDSVKVYFTKSNVDQIVGSCNNLVLQEANYEYCCVNKTIKLESEEQEMTCSDASQESWGSEIDKLDCVGVC